jgi:hypothetical protein
MDLHDVSSDADVQSCGGDIRDGADGDDQRRDQWRDDLLHDERDDADDLVDAIHRSDYGECDGDGRSDRGGEWVCGQCGGHGGLYDHAIGGDTDVQSRGRDIYGATDGDDQRRDQWGDDLLHDERDDADNLVDAIHRSDHGQRNHDDSSDRRGERLPEW